MLTRDRELLRRCEVTHGCFVHALKSALQLRQVFERLDRAGSMRPFRLCLACNVPPRPIDKALLRSAIKCLPVLPRYPFVPSLPL